MTLHRRQFLGHTKPYTTAKESGVTSPSRPSFKGPDGLVTSFPSGISIPYFVVK